MSCVPPLRPTACLPTARKNRCTSASHEGGREEEARPPNESGSTGNASPIIRLYSSEEGRPAVRCTLAPSSYALKMRHEQGFKYTTVRRMASTSLIRATYNQTKSFPAPLNSEQPEQRFSAPRPLGWSGRGAGGRAVSSRDRGQRAGPGGGPAARCAAGAR